MVGGAIYRWLMQKPLRTGILAGTFTVPLSSYFAFTSDAFSKSFLDTTVGDAVELGVLFASPLVCAAVTGGITNILKAFTYEDKYHPKTRLSDFKKRRQIKKELAAFNFDLLVDESGQHREDLLHELGQQNPGFKVEHQVNVIVHEDVFVNLDGIKNLEGQQQIVEELLGGLIEIKFSVDAAVVQVD